MLFCQTLTDVVPFPSISLASVQCIFPEWIKLQVAPLFQVCPLGKWENTAIKLAPLRVGHESYLWSRRIVFVEFYWIHATAKTAASGNDTAVMLTHLKVCCIFARRKSHSATNVGPWQGNHAVNFPEALDWQNLFGPTRNLDKICLCQISICQAWAHWDSNIFVNHLCQSHETRASIAKFEEFTDLPNIAGAIDRTQKSKGCKRMRCRLL